MEEGAAMLNLRASVSYLCLTPTSSRCARPGEIILTFCVPIILLVRKTVGHLDGPASPRGLEHRKRLREGTSGALLWAVRSMECGLPVAFRIVCFLQD